MTCHAFADQLHPKRLPPSRDVLTAQPGQQSEPRAVIACLFVSLEHILRVTKCPRWSPTKPRSCTRDGPANSVVLSFDPGRKVSGLSADLHNSNNKIE